MSEHENAPAAPPEGEAEAILRRKEVRQPCSGKRGDGPWVLVEPAIYLSVTERDTVLAALAAATARADEDEAGRLRWEQEAERLRGERADLQHKLAHWQRVAEESGTMVARRVEAMLRYAIACLTEPDDDRKAVYDQILAGFRALPATPAPEKCEPPDNFSVAAAAEDLVGDTTPAPGPSAEGPWTVRLEQDPDCVPDQWWVVVPPKNDAFTDEVHLRTEAEARAVAAALNGVTPGPTAEEALRWAWLNRPEMVGQRDNRWRAEQPDEYAARGLAALTRAPGGQDVR